MLNNPISHLLNQEIGPNLIFAQYFKVTKLVRGCVWLIGRNKN